MEGDILGDLWKAHYVDRRVKEAIRGLLDNVDRKAVKLIRQQVPDLAPKDIAESIRRLDIRIEIPSALPELKVPKRGAGMGGGKPRKKQRQRTEYGVTLADVIAAGMLKPPLQLFRKYRGRLMEASLQADGRVDFQGQSYESCSQAASVARSTITGRPMHTNGWCFWLYRAEAGKCLSLDSARQRLLKAKAKGS
jgi:hypothetical protein